MADKQPVVEMTLDEIQSELNSIRDEVFWIGLELDFVLDKLKLKNGFGSDE